MFPAKEPKPTAPLPLETAYSRINGAISSPNNLISPLNSKHIAEILTTVDPPSTSSVHKPALPEWNTVKSLKRNHVVDMKPFKRAKSLTVSEGPKKEDPELKKPNELPRTKFYLTKITNLFKRSDSQGKRTEEERTSNRANLKSLTTIRSGRNKVFPDPRVGDQQLETVNEDDDKLDIEFFDKEILMESPSKEQRKEEVHEIYQKVQHIIQLEEEEYVYQNLHDSDEENDDNDRKFKLIDSALMYERELSRVSNAEPFYSLFTQKKNIFEMNAMYSDKYPFLEFRKKVMFIKCLICHGCYLIISSKTFEAISLMIIIWNTAMMMIDPNSTSSVSSTFDEMFLILYTVEMGLKILALGFVLSEGSYLRDYWNVLDFVIISTGYLPYVINSSSINLSALRSLRVLRPLRSISKIKALKTILVTLFTAMPLIMSSVMVNLFFLLIFAIAGLQLFSGLLKKRCYDPFTGLLMPQDPDQPDPMIRGVICGNQDCPGVYICGRLVANPNQDIINFDTIFYSFLMIFQSITLEGWTQIMYYVVRSFSIYTIIFFIVLVWIGAYFLVNLTLAVISLKFKEAENKDKGEQESVSSDEDEKPKGPSVIDIRNLKLCEKAHHKRALRKLGLENRYGANEEVFKKEKDEIRWDDLFELKERIREERERFDADEDFKKMRDQELEGSNYKKPRKRNNLKYLPKSKIRGNNPNFTQKIVHNSKKLKFVGIQGVNVTKSPNEGSPDLKEKSPEVKDKKKTPNQSPGRKQPKVMEKNRNHLEVEKTDEEAMQLINLNEEDLFLRESAEKALTFKETKPDNVSIASLLMKPKIFKKNTLLNNSERKSILHTIEKEQVFNQEGKVGTSDEKIQSMKAVNPTTHHRFSRKHTAEFSSIKKSSGNDKRQSLQMASGAFFENQLKFAEGRRKTAVKTEAEFGKNILRRKSTRRLTKKMSKLSSFSGGDADGSNLASTILNDSDFNIAGFEKAEKKELTPELHSGHRSPYTKQILSSTIKPESMNKIDRPPNNLLLPMEIGNVLEISAEQSINNLSLHENNKPQTLNKFFSGLKLQNIVSQAMEKDKEDKASVQREISLDLKPSNSNAQIPETDPQKSHPDYSIKDLNLSKQIRETDPTTLLQTQTNPNDPKLMKKIKERKVMRRLIPAAAFTQVHTDPENAVVDETDGDLENGQVRNYSEQASTRTFLESKNTLDPKEKLRGFFKRTLTTLKRKATQKQTKEELERQKRLLLQKKFNVLHFKLMINTAKEYESNSTDDVWASRIEKIRRLKAEQFEKKIRTTSKMPVSYMSKQMNIKKLEKQRRREERKMILEIEKRRNNSIDFQTLTDSDILKKILKISKNYKRLPLNIHRNLVTILIKQRNVLFGDRGSRSKAASLLTPGSKSNLTNQSMHVSQKAKGKKKKKAVCKIVYDYENLKEHAREKLYEKSQVEEQLREFNEDELYQKIWLLDFENGMKRDFYVDLKINLRWSGDDTIDFNKFYYERGLKTNNNEPLSLHKVEKFQLRINRLIHAMSTISMDKDVWLKGLSGKLKTFQKYVAFLVNSRFFEHLFIIAVLINTVILAMDGLFYDTTTTTLLDTFNFYLTMTFTVEMGLKIIGETPKRYLSDKMNVFDGAVVTISQVELWALSGTKGLSAFRTVRIFRTFRVLRVTRLLRSLEFMKVIINVVGRCIDSLIYIGFLLLLFNVIYSLIGIQIFSGNMDNSIGIRQNFNDFQSAFLVVYQLMTVENWNDVLTVTMNSGVGASIVCIYLISWIFIGNYVFLNLILAILLEAFADEWEAKSKAHYDDFEDYEQKEIERKKKEEIEKQQEKKIETMEIEELENELLVKNHKKHEKPLYTGVSCQNSIFLFPKTNLIRKACYIIVHSPIFEHFILFLIVSSSMKLAIDTYLPNDDTSINEISSNIDISFNVVFAMEAFMKVISFGFVMDEGSYLRDNWNILDFTIVVSSLIDMSVSSINLPFIKILRLLRTLRPLRFISHNLNMKIVVTALLESAGPIANVSIVVLLIFLMFSIFGMSLLQDRFGYCAWTDAYGNPQNNYGVNIDSCGQIQGAVWTNKDDNFDNIFRAMLSVFILSTQENWPNLMFDGMDSNTSDIGPIQNSIPYISYFYMICLFVTNIFLINLFVGVIFMNFIEATNSNNPYHSIFLTPEQERWLDFQKMISAAKSDFNSYLLPANKYSRKIYIIVNDKYFELFIMFCIVFNIITMALTYDGSSSYYDKVLENVNYFFTAVFILESMLKVIGMGPRAYWYLAWNRFDLFVVSTSIIDILTTNLGSGLFSFLRVGPQIARVFRVMRVSRLLKLVKSLKGIQKLLETLILALPALMNVGALLLLVFFIFSVLGVFLFQDITSGTLIDDLNNFSNFTFAMVLLFRCSTGESWWVFMFDTYKQNPYAPLFWIPFIVVCSFIMLNLFILVILDEFEKYSKKGDSPQTVFKEAIGEFRKNWSALTRSTGGIKMPARILIDFFKMLQPDLGFGKEARREMVAKEIMKMNIVGDENNNVYFNEVLFGAMKRTYGDLEWTTEVVDRKRVKVKKRIQPITNKMITEQEVLTKRRIEKMKHDLIKKEHRRLKKLRSAKSNATPSNAQSSVLLEMKSSNTLLEEGSKTIIKASTTIGKKKVYLNPLVTILFVGMTFKSWLNFMRKVKLGDIQNDLNFDDESNFSEEEEDFSERSESIVGEDVFNDEEQKEYEEKARKPKIPKKNLLEYEEGSESQEEEEENEIPENKERAMKEDSKKVFGEDPDQDKKVNKPILRNTRMSAFASMEKKGPSEKQDTRYSMNPALERKLTNGMKMSRGALISEEREANESDDDE